MSNFSLIIINVYDVFQELNWSKAFSRQLLHNKRKQNLPISKLNSKKYETTELMQLDND